MRITSTTTWAVSKDGQSIELTLEDIQQLLSHLAWASEILVFDETTGRCGEDINEIAVSLNGNAVQITLLKEMSKPDAQPEVTKTRDAQGGVL